MENLKLASSVDLPETWQPKYFLHLIARKEPILIDEKEYNGILRLLEEGRTFVKIRNYVIMLNSITIISPRYEPDNIPPKPILKYEFDSNGQSKISNKEEIDKWEALFNSKQNDII